MNTITAFTMINPTELYDPRPNGYSHVAVIQPNMRVIHIAGQGGEQKNGELSQDFDQQVQQVFYNIQYALASAQAKLQDIAVLRVLVVNHNEDKLHSFTQIMQRLWKDHPYPVCTLIPVPCLALEGMLIEVEATAYIA
ncbi:RidA family protein [Acinetobacter haemolyticus]|uniref:RidA family protein n=1 Tax=Acinetobacter haemolyticus TaxID=29430 RepID=A0AAJ2YQV3_ACIHA|nr:Rid family hydrolase [Acinetobacter haemolyticus]NAR18252.1 RidA family protein [Acinetobacter haemolyticus]NAR28911.1 RidA family protein [Acinetobacter haemolyticus]NAR35735.1 RidA family protein [Acinetobacter haemolyticus]NAR46693.1 RidA family protein [Acinetobacter haemolyticus]NAR64720.1 RidA family protein [Acinetobacter haemolyticus]